MTYQLVREHVSDDTVEAFEQLAIAAKAGHIVGAAFCVLMKRRRYIVDTSGELRRDPTLARGILASLDDELREMVHTRTDSNTTI